MKECKIKVRAWKARKGQCDQFQELMDASSCKAAIISKVGSSAFDGATCCHSMRLPFRSQQDQRDCHCLQLVWRCNGAGMVPVLIWARLSKHAGHTVLPTNLITSAEQPSEKTKHPQTNQQQHQNTTPGSNGLDLRRWHAAHRFYNLILGRKY